MDMPPDQVSFLEKQPKLFYRPPERDEYLNIAEALDEIFERLDSIEDKLNNMETK